MKDFLKTYQMKLVTLGPVYIGNGHEFGKKEYVFLDSDRIGIIDIEKLYSFMRKKGLSRDFENYVLKDRRTDPKHWMLEHHIRLDEMEQCMKYVLEKGDSVVERGTRIQVLEFVKDPFGKPYVPGSSIKGMLRTILLGGDILKESTKYQQEKESIERNISWQKNRTQYLKTDEANLENRFYHTLHRSRNANDVVNDQMAGIRVSDSKTLDAGDLILCQKLDKHVDGKEGKLNVFRECIRPGTEISFTLTIDESLTNITEKDIMDAVQLFSEEYYEKFRKFFSGTDRPIENEVYLGGGCGYFSKTVLHALYKGKKYIPPTQKVFENTDVRREHQHEKDMEYGVAPHMLKCTRYQGKLYEMGKCRLESV